MVIQKYILYIMQYLHYKNGVGAYANSVYHQMDTGTIFSDSEDFSQNSFTGRYEKPMLEKKIKKDKTKSVKSLQTLSEKNPGRKKKDQKIPCLTKTYCQEKNLDQNLTNQPSSAISSLASLFPPPLQSTPSNIQDPILPPDTGLSNKIEFLKGLSKFFYLYVILILYLGFFLVLHKLLSHGSKTN